VLWGGAARSALRYFRVMVTTPIRSGDDEGIWVVCCDDAATSIGGDDVAFLVGCDDEATPEPTDDDAAT